MSLQFFWQVPTAGDVRPGTSAIVRRGERDAGAPSPLGKGVSDPRGERFNHFDYLHQVARAAELAGFDGIQIPHDPAGEESWIVTGYLARDTRKLTLLTEFEAAWGSPVYAAKNAATLQRYTGQRIAWQISAGGDAASRRQQADPVPQDKLTARLDEFVTVARGVATQSPFNFKGEFYEVLEGGFKGPLARVTAPPVFLSGVDEAALALSARQADVHVFPALPLRELAATDGPLPRLRALAKAQGREVAIGLRIDVLARDSSNEALHDARRFWAQSGHTPGSDPFRDANFWAGLTTAHTGAAAALVGSHQEVVRRLTEFAEAGVTHFILAGVPRFEEAYQVGAHVLPVLRQQFQLPHGRTQGAQPQPNKSLESAHEH
ncbi:LLM class flavin-dependent oxidoreductase [Chitinimonas sp. BJYL2]|uniref:LLM class flavin-dependent oxidoreductase n=1 Tax=Chitinimonas sp. BJYL2 TaxID=2976696 RepID=UPI0022B5C3C2|nr:LLM class flavin-dependent oxidoreductase [Chitinimonas sp. BJYL2]